MERKTGTARETEPCLLLETWTQPSLPSWLNLNVSAHRRSNTHRREWMRACVGTFIGPAKMFFFWFPLLQVVRMRSPDQAGRLGNIGPQRCTGLLRAGLDSSVPAVSEACPRSWRGGHPFGLDITVDILNSTEDLLLPLLIKYISAAVLQWQCRMWNGRHPARAKD